MPRKCFTLRDRDNKSGIFKGCIVKYKFGRSQRSAEKRARQLDWIYENKETKASTWFYYDLIHNDWRFLNGIKRYISN